MMPKRPVDVAVAETVSVKVRLVLAVTLYAVLATSPVSESDAERLVTIVGDCVELELVVVA